MNLQIYYNGADVTDSFDLRECVLTDRYGGLLDSMRLTVNDTDDRWKILRKGDAFLVNTDGYSSGNMYLANAESKDKVRVIDAVSLKPSKKIVKSKVWWNVKLSEILTDCAKSNGLSLKTYGITDYTYESLAQIQKTDLEFANSVCVMEGYSVKVDNDCLIVFNERFIESQNEELTITPEDTNTNFSFAQSSNCVNSVTVSHYDIDKGLIEHTATDNEIFGASEIINQRVSSHDEARRFAYGYLRARNKRHIVGRMTMSYRANISAGTVFTARGFQEYDGKYVVIEVSHSIKKELTSITARKVLNY